MRNLFLSLSRMPPFLMLLLIVGLAVSATFLYMHESGQKQAQLDQLQRAHEQEANLKGPVVYAAKDIPEGTEITADALEQRDQLQTKIPAGALTSPSAGVGGLAAYPIQQGSIVLQNAVKPHLAQQGFEGKIKDGFRAVTFGIDSNAGVAGFVSPGAHVDILCITGAAAETKAAPVLSDVEVIAVGTTYRKAPGETQASQSSSVTVLVDPENAEKLVKAVSASKPYLTLRNEKDRTPLATVDVTALFPKPLKSDQAVGGEIASNTIPSSSLPLPLPLPQTNSGTGSGSDAGGGVPAPLHEIELWSGSKKEVLQVPQS